MASYVDPLRYPNVIPNQMYNFQIPDKNILVKDLREGLKPYFQDVFVEIVKCPDLSEQPFNLAGPGLCGKTAIIDLGETTNLPVSHKKVYSIEDIIISLKSSYITPCIFGDTIIAHYPHNKLYELVMNACFWPKMNQENNQEFLDTGFLPEIYEQTYINYSSVTHISKCQMLPVHELVVKRPHCIERGTFFLCDNSSNQDVIQIYAKKGRSSFLGKATEFTDVLQCVLYQMRKKYVLALGGVYKTNNVIWKHRVYPYLELKETSSRPSICTIEMPAIRMAIFNSNITGYTQTSQNPIDKKICKMTRCLSHHSLAEHNYTIYNSQNNDIEYLGYFTPVETLYCVDKPTSQ